MLKVLIISFLMAGTFSVADSYYADTERVNYQRQNDVLKLKLEIYQLKEKNLELQKIIDDFKMTKEQRQVYKRQEAIQDLRQQLRSSRKNKISLNF